MSDIPAGDGKTANLFYSVSMGGYNDFECLCMHYYVSVMVWRGGGGEGRGEDP